MPEQSVKGTVTQLSSLYPVEEMEKALKHIQNTLNEKQKELDNLNNFIVDNTNLINQVQSLPDELHHNIMVPFGKVAFFPGSLIHTNEFLVLLGEGYYAQRTSKQTIEILRRRENALESQVADLKANMKDIESKASFFASTAAEAKEGLVEIREDYVEEEPEVNVPSVSGVSTVHAMDDEEFARITARFDELEKEDELFVDTDLEQNVQTHMEKEFTELKLPKIESENRDHQVNEYDESRLGSSNQQSVQHVKSYGDKHLLNKVEAESAAKNYKPSARKISNQCLPTSNEIPTVHRLGPDHDSLRAFSGSIIERMDNLPPPNGQTPQPSSSRPSRPVSRFRKERT